MKTERKQNPKPAYLKPVIHSMKRRARWHNYYDRGVYMVTISKAPERPSFGSLKYTRPDDALISLSPLGLIIKELIEITPSYTPEIKIHEYVIMPDHFHILLQVTEPMSRNLGEVIQALKSTSTSRIRKLLNNQRLNIFEDDYNDRIIKSREQFETVANYLRDNPRRLAVRRGHPEYFRRVNELRIGEKTYQAYGNFQLLDCPFKEQVVIHRADTETTRRHNRQSWLYTAANRGVLVSPFISPAEKEIRLEAEEAGGRFILIVNEPMGDRYKPTGHDFDLCEAGRLLIISISKPGALSRQACLVMNSLAALIAAQLR